jgi:dihydroxyacetone kinase
VLSKVDSGEIKDSDLIYSIITIAQVAKEEMGGTSGALYSYEFFSLNRHISQKSHHILLGSFSQLWRKVSKQVH